MKRWIFLALLIAVIVWSWYEPAADWQGQPAPRDPQQQPPTSLAVAFTSGGHTFTPLASYAITAVVLGAKRYRYDRGAAFAPVDLALGWGPMSAAPAINGLKISQSGRWYEYEWGAKGPPIAADEIARHSANTHCIPATAEIRRQLLAVHRHDLVTMSGYLVEVLGPGGYRWRSSVSREDTRGGSCEVFWITSLNATPIHPDGH